jgi:hypothetical protein
MLARAAYEKAIGKPSNILHESGLTREDALEELTELYRTFGVARGPEHTEQLVRSFESQAAAQANSRQP